MTLSRGHLNAAPSLPTVAIMRLLVTAAALAVAARRLASFSIRGEAA